MYLIFPNFSEIKYISIINRGNSELVMTEVLSKNYSGIMLHENGDENVYGSDANFTLEHCGCQRFLKGIVIPNVELSFKLKNTI